MNKKIAILLMAYGSPNSLDEVGEYLRQVRGGRSPTEMEVERLRERYGQVGGRTPLLKITMAQAEALQRRLDSGPITTKVYVGMKHWHPFIEDTVETIVSEGASSLVGLALAPHYSKLSIGGYEDAIRKGLSKTKSIPFSMIKDWHQQPDLIKALSERVRGGLDRMEEPSEATVLFTAHSLPKRFVSADDPYESQLRETSATVARQAGAAFWDFAFQSAGEPMDAWLGPMIKDKIAEHSKEGFREVLVCPIGFVSDHLEIIYDLDIEAKEYGRSLGMTVARTASLNDDPTFVEALAATVEPLLTANLATS